MGDAYLLVATDRVSAFDVILSEGLPGKGALLTQISLYWFEQVAQRTRHHLGRRSRPAHRTVGTNVSGVGRAQHDCQEAATHCRSRRWYAATCRARVGSIIAKRASCLNMICRWACRKATACRSRCLRPPPRRPVATICRLIVRMLRN